MTGCNEPKLRELILYVAACSEDDRTFGKTKLHKILFYADFLAYVEIGEPITGAEHRRHPYGPVAPCTEAALSDLQAEGSAAISRRHYFGRLQERVLTLRDPDLTAFSAAEIAVVDRVIHLLRDMTAAGVSELSHRFVGWQIARDDEVIPYETALLDFSDPTEDEIAHARELQQAGL